jgi:hypothetical protein
MNKTLNTSCLYMYVGFQRAIQYIPLWGHMNSMHIVNLGITYRRCLCAEWVWYHVWYILSYSLIHLINSIEDALWNPSSGWNGGIFCEGKTRVFLFQQRLHEITFNYVFVVPWDPWLVSLCQYAYNTLRSAWNVSLKVASSVLGVMTILSAGGLLIAL